MLAGETAVGAFPARAVQTLDAIIRDAEIGPPDDGAVVAATPTRHDHAQALCEAAVTLADRSDARGDRRRHARAAARRGGCRRCGRTRRSSRRATTRRRRGGCRSTGACRRSDRHRRERGDGGHARSARSSWRAGWCRAAPCRARQHQPGSRPGGRQLPEDSAVLMAGPSTRRRAPAVPPGVHRRNDEPTSTSITCRQAPSSRPQRRDA